MARAVDSRPLALATLITALLLAWVTVAGSATPVLRAPSIDFGGPSARGASVAAEAYLPEYAAYLTACEVASGLPRCPTTVRPSSTLIGRVSPGFGVDGRLDAGAVDRFHVAGSPTTLSARLDGDLGAVLGVYAGGIALVDPADGRRNVADVTVPPDVTVVQVIVLNQTLAPRTYVLSVEDR